MSANSGDQPAGSAGDDEADGEQVYSAKQTIEIFGDGDEYIFQNIVPLSIWATTWGRPYESNIAKRLPVSNSFSLATASQNDLLA